MTLRKSAAYVLVLLAVIYLLAFLFAGCSAPRYGCGDARYFVGYGPGGYHKGQMKH